MPVIRHAKPADDAELVRLDRITWARENSPLLERPDADEMLGRVGAGHEILVADEGPTRLAGYVHLAPATSLESNSHVFELRGLAVDPAEQGRGVGLRLLEAAADRARERGGRKLRLRVLATNRRAIALYERAGFEHEATLAGEFVIGGDPVDDVLMVRKLA